MKRLLLLGLVLLIASITYAKTINGKIVDETNTPLIGVTILNENNKKSTVSDIDGLYSIEAKRKDILSFQIENYHPIFIEVKKSKLLITMKLVVQQNFVRCHGIIPATKTQNTLTDSVQKNKKSIVEILETQIPNGYVVSRDTLTNNIKDIPFEDRLYIINGKPTKLKDSGILDSEELQKIKTVKEEKESLFIINGKVSTVKQFRAIDPKKS